MEIVMLAIIYCRVSTTDQAEHGYSLGMQEKECHRFALNNGYEVDRTFIERGESAKTQDRTELQKLIKYAVTNKKKISALVIWKYDRLTRSLADLMGLDKNFNSLGIKILSVTENNEDNSIGRLTRNMAGVIAQYENDIKSERTIGGMKQAVQHGRWCWLAPLGYKYSKDSLNKSILIPTEESIFVVEAFELAKAGLYKHTEIVERLKKKGLKITGGHLKRILKNPLYAGLIKVKWFPGYIDAIHKSIISKDKFLEVQYLLDGKKPTITPKVRNHPDFPLRNFIRCPKCQQKLTGSYSTGRKNKKYPYYHCRTKGCSLNIKKQEFETKFYEFLKSIQPDEKIWNLFEVIITDVWKNKQTEKNKEESRLKRELKELNEKKDRVNELVIKGTFDEDTYKQKSEAIKEEILVKQIELGELTTDINDVDRCIYYCKFFMLNVAKLWDEGDINLKQRFQTLIFPKEIYYKKETFGTTATALIFKQLEPKSLQELHLVAPREFESPSPP